MPYLQIAIIAGTFAINYYYSRKAKAEARQAKEDSEKEPIKRGGTTEAQEGSIVPLVFGTCRIHKPNIICWGGPGSIREYIATTEAKHNDVGNFSAWLILGVCINPMDDTTFIWRRQWVGPYQHENGGIPATDADGFYNPLNDFDGFPTRRIINTDAWGGPKKGGGYGTGNWALGHISRWLFRDGRATQAEHAHGRIQQWARGNFDDGYPEWNPSTGDWVHDPNDSQGLTASSYPDSHYGGMPGIAHIIISDWLLGEGSSIPGINVEVTVFPDYTGTIESRVDFNSEGDANPAAVIYQILTNTFIGMGIPTASIDVTSFNQVGVTCNVEKNGFSAAFYQEQTTQKLLETVLEQIEGVIYTDPDDLLIHLALVRKDYGAYPYVSLDTYDDSNVIEIVDYKLSSWEDTFNEVRLKYEDRATEYETRYAIQQNHNREQVKSITVDFPGIKNSTLANEICARELSYYAIPQLSVVLRLNREASKLRPTDVFKWSCIEYGIENMILRVLKVDLGEPGDSSVLVHCAQDKYAAIPAVFADPGRTWLDDFGSQAVAPSCYKVEEVPDNPFFGGTDWQQPEWGNFVTLAGGANSNGSGDGSAGLVGSNISVSNDFVVGTYQDPSDSTDNFGTECGMVGVAYSSTSPYYDTSFGGLEVGNLSIESVLRNNTDEEIRAGSAVLLIGNEFMSYESFTLQTPPTYRSSDQTETAVSQTDIVITAPAGVVEGDLLVAIINFGSTLFSTAPAGWSHVNDSPHTNELGATDNNMVVMTKPATASEPANYTFTCESAEAAEINGSIHAIENGGVVEFAKFVDYNTSHTGPAVISDLYTGGTDTECAIYITALGSSGEWYTAGSLISPTAGFTEIDDLAGTTGNHLQVQYSTTVAAGPVLVDLNISGTTPTTTHTAFSMGVRRAASGNTYKLNNVWRGLFDTEAEDHPLSEPVFFLTANEMSRKSGRKGSVCESEEVLLKSTVKPPGRFRYGEIPAVYGAMSISRRDQRPTRPTSFVLRNDGADAAASSAEIDYAYNAQKRTEIINASVVGADAKLSAAGVYGDVWTNDLRGTWNRRPKISDCSIAIVRGDDADAAYGDKEDTAHLVAVKRDQDSTWTEIVREDVKGGPITQNTDFIDMSEVEAGPGALRLCAYNASPINGDEVLSHTAESVTINVHTSRQLLLNPNFRPYWDVDSDSSVAGSKGEILPGNPVYSARGWRNVTAGAGRPRYKVMPGSILQGVDTQGFAMTGEFTTGEYVTVEQVVAVPYLDTEGSEVYLSWWFQAGVADETEWYDVTIDTLDVDGVVLDTINVADNAGTAVDTWSKYDLTLASISGAARSIRATIGIRRLTDAGSPALCKVSMVMGRDTAANQLLNPQFNTPLTSWTSVGTAWTAELTPTNGGGIDPVDVNFSRFAQSGLTDGEIYQDVAIPAAYGTGDYVRLQWWTASTASPGYGYIVLSTRDDLSAPVESITVGSDPTHPILDQWYYHEAYLKITGECADVRASINYKDAGGAGQDFLCDAMDMTFIKGGHS